MAVERGLIPGPRLKISVVILSQFGGHNDHTEAAGINTHFPWLQGIPSGICDGVDECRKKTREVIRAGADWVKIATTGTTIQHICCALLAGGLEGDTVPALAMHTSERPALTA